MNIQNIAEDILWDAVGEYVEIVCEFKKMVDGITYIDHQVVSEVEWCEVFESEEIIVNEYKIEGEKIHIEFEMPFILNAWKNDEALFRVTSLGKGKAILQDNEVVEIEDVEYVDVEVDSMYA